MKGTAINIQAELISITREIRDKRMGRACKGGRTMKSRRFFFFFALTQTLLIHLAIVYPCPKAERWEGVALRVIS